MDKILRVIQRFPVILATILLFLSTGVCWYVFVEKNSTNIYYLSTIIYLISSFLLVIGSFKYRLFKIRSTVLLLGASLLLVVALFDFYLLTFCFDTSGPGGQNVITHRHW